jgi:Fur family ferric uptake transcriptional regulator
LEELKKLTTHPTAVGLYEIVRRRLPKISLGTVYRNLELLARQGTIQKLYFDEQQARFDGDVSRHDHIVCMKCGRMDDIHCPPIDLLTAAANDCGGYRLLDRRVQFVGICPRCLENMDKLKESQLPTEKENVRC